MTSCPGSGRAIWKGHETFATIASRVGLAEFWSGGSKKPTISNLLTQTLQHKHASFENLILGIVRSGLVYREKQGNPITTGEIDLLNGHIIELGFKFPELWDRDFRASLQRTTTERAREHVEQAEAKHKQQSAEAYRSQELQKLKQQLFELHAETDRQKAGLLLEPLLNHLFALFELEPRRPFTLVGEQIDEIV